MSSWFAVFLNCFLIGLVLSYSPNSNLTTAIALVGLVSFYFDHYVLVAAFYLILASYNWLVLDQLAAPNFLNEILPALAACLIVGAVILKTWIRSRIQRKIQVLKRELKEEKSKLAGMQNFQGQRLAKLMLAKQSLKRLELTTRNLKKLELLQQVLKEVSSATQNLKKLEPLQQVLSTVSSVTQNLEKLDLEKLEELKQVLEEIELKKRNLEKLDLKKKLEELKSAKHNLKKVEQLQQVLEEVELTTQNLEKLDLEKQIEKLKQARQNLEKLELEEPTAEKLRLERLKLKGLKSKALDRLYSLYIRNRLLDEKSGRSILKSWLLPLRRYWLSNQIIQENKQLEKELALEQEKFSRLSTCLEVLTIEELEFKQKNLEELKQRSLEELKSEDSEFECFQSKVLNRFCRLQTLDRWLNLPFIVTGLSLALALLLSLSHLTIWQANLSAVLLFPGLTASGFCFFLIGSLSRFMERSLQCSTSLWIHRLLEQTLLDLELLEFLNPKYRFFPDKRRKAAQNFCQMILQGGILIIAVLGLLMGVAGKYVR